MAGDPELSREEFYHALSALSKSVDMGFEGVNRRLDSMNGQVREHGEAIAVLEDRGMQDNTGRGLGITGILTAIATFIYQHFMTGKP